MGLNAKMLEGLKLTKGDLIEIEFKQPNNTTHVTLPVYFLNLNIKENRINYAKKRYYTGGIIDYSSLGNKMLSELEEVIKEGPINKVRVSVLTK